VDEDQGAEFVRDGEKPVQAWVAELGVSDSGANLDADKAALAHAATHLVDRAVRILQRDGGQSGEAGWVFAGDSSEELVLCRRQFGSSRR
jgi:hypothetical protein